MKGLSGQANPESPGYLFGWTNTHQVKSTSLENRNVRCLWLPACGETGRCYELHQLNQLDIIHLWTTYQLRWCHLPPSTACAPRLSPPSSTGHANALALPHPQLYRGTVCPFSCSFILWPTCEYFDSKRKPLSKRSTRTNTLQGHRFTECRFKKKLV